MWENVYLSIKNAPLHMPTMLKRHCFAMWAVFSTKTNSCPPPPHYRAGSATRTYPEIGDANFEGLFTLRVYLCMCVCMCVYLGVCMCVSVCICIKLQHCVYEDVVSTQRMSIEPFLWVLCQIVYFDASVNEALVCIMHLETAINFKMRERCRISIVLL